MSIPPVRVCRNSPRVRPTERRRQLTEESLSALRDAGLLRLGTPRTLGGHGAPVRTAIEVCAELARGCASSSWIVAIAYGAARFVAQLPDSVRQVIWADPDSVICGATGPSGTVRMVSDGLVLSGRWPWVSGIRHASWVLLGFDLSGLSNEPDRGLALVNAEDVADSGHMAGMRGTGSETAIVDEVLVPRDRLLSYAEMADGVGLCRHPGEARVVVRCLSICHSPVPASASHKACSSMSWQSSRRDSAD